MEDVKTETLLDMKNALHDEVLKIESVNGLMFAATSSGVEVDSNHLAEVSSMIGQHLEKLHDLIDAITAEQGMRTELRSIQARIDTFGGKLNPEQEARDSISRANRLVASLDSWKQTAATLRKKAESLLREKAA